MGTANVLLLAGDEAVARQAAHEAFALFERLEQKLSKFLPDSEVSLVNALAAERDVVVGAELLELLEFSRRAWELTDGANKAGSCNSTDG